MTPAPTPSPGAEAGRTVLLLGGQAFTLGLCIAWVTIGASTVFLDRYGSGMLPVTYLGAAAAGAATSVLLGSALRRRALVDVTVRILAGTALALALSWLALVHADAAAVSFALLVLLPLAIPVGFVFVVGQAGALLDVRRLKALYPRVVAGFASGFTIGGLAGPLLLDAFGPAENLLAFAALAAVAFLALVAWTRATYPDVLCVVEHADSGDRPATGAVLADRLVVLVIAFQVLSAIESQWLDFLVYDRAAARYPDSDQLAEFVSRFTAIAYGADIVFLLLVAGLLLRRFGLRVGLATNPVVVLSLVAAVVAGTALVGSAATVVFVLVVATRVSDMVLSDGTTRTSVGAAYQAVPARLRLAAQSLVESLAVPVAIGFSGLVLIVVRQTVGTDGLALPLLTAVVLVAWLVVAVLAYRAYRVSLLDNLRHRLLDPDELAIDGPATRAAIDRLLDSDDERDVRLGADTLARAGDPGLAGHLERLAVSAPPAVRAFALDRLVVLDAAGAAAAARRAVGDADPTVRAAVLRALDGAGRDRELVVAGLHDPDVGVRLAAAAAVVRWGDEAAHRRLATEIARAAASEVPGDRVLAAGLLAVAGAPPWLPRRLLHDLLDDPDPAVARAALGALDWSADEDATASVLALLGRRTTAGAAVEALSRGGEVALALADEGLAGRLGLDRRSLTLLVRAARHAGGPAVAGMLARHVDHPDRDLGLEVLRALADAHGGRPTPGDPLALRGDLEHLARVLRAIEVLAQEPAAVELRSALRDEEGLLRRRILAHLSVRHGAEGVGRVAFQLAQHDVRAHAVALEWLDVTLAGLDRTAIVVLDPEADDRARLRALSRVVEVPEGTPSTVVTDLVDDEAGVWRRPWLSACALLAASREPSLGLDPTGRDPGAVDPFEHPDDDGSVVHETLDAIIRRAASAIA